ncbi:MULTISPECIES: hypothetical protein [unclassified Streptomyces]|uniref:hypothetical protein n=1 Tax=unclassified Streptomyces TaxID=2593676 RepID=UPI001F20DA90|nr:MULTISPECIES: hypothetical protein [unclassified Streptomyces]
MVLRRTRRRPRGPAFRGRVRGRQVAAIEDAQRRGTVTDRMGAGGLLALVLVIATMRRRHGDDIRSLVPTSERRRVVVESVRQLATA